MAQRRHAPNTSLGRLRLSETSDFQKRSLAAIKTFATRVAKGQRAPHDSRLLAHLNPIWAGLRPWLPRHAHPLDMPPPLGAEEKKEEPELPLPSMVPDPELMARHDADQKIIDDAKSLLAEDLPDYPATDEEESEDLVGRLQRQGKSLRDLTSRSVAARSQDSISRKRSRSPVSQSRRIEIKTQPAESEFTTVVGGRGSHTRRRQKKGALRSQPRQIHELDHASGRAVSRQDTNRAKRIEASREQQ